ncbi:MAG TPA: response regulator [Gaiellaceae bacterium]|nr:response regulator [Gaiellaceae bacterium]
MTAQGPLVLIVDDNERNRKLAREVLQLAGFRTVEAATGRAGIEVAVEHLPDVILLDLRLPDMDGTAVARSLRDDPRTAPLPIVALTSLALHDEGDWLRQVGFDGYLEKPIDVREFPEHVRRYCR